MKAEIRSTLALLLALSGCEFSTGEDEEDAGDRGATGVIDNAKDAGTRIAPDGAVVSVPGSGPTPAAPPATTGGPGASEAGVAAASDGGSGAGSVAVASCGLPAGLASFKPSNLQAELGLVLHDALTISHGQSIDTDSLVFKGTWSEEGAPLQLVNTPDGELAVLYVKSFTTVTAGGITVVGQRPLVILAADKIEIASTIVTNVSGTNGYAAGGAPGAASPERKGFGTGGGPAGNATTGGGGGSYCGVGGLPLGSSQVAAPTYGNESLIPLLGGSSGGSSVGGSNAAGGALQLVAGGSVLIKETAVINAPGRGAPNYAGGSSGGAILIEAPEVSVLGVLAANGASGGSSIWEGFDGTITNSPQVPHDANPGKGSGGMTINGGNALDLRSGAGGGVGRIRLNSSCKLTLGANAVITPNKGTPCYSEGGLLAHL